MTVKKSSVEKGRLFESRVAELFKLHGFSVEVDLLIEGRQVDLMISDRSGPLTREYIVECKDQASTVTTSQIDAFSSKLKAAKKRRPKLRGIFVSSLGFVKEAKAHCEADEIELATIMELERSLIDFSGYIDTLITRLERDETLRHFIPPKFLREHQGIPEDALTLLDAWLVDPTCNQLTVLGDYGTGKTTLLKYLALQLARKLRGGTLDWTTRIPIFVDLRDFTHAISLKSIILELLDSHGIHAKSYSTFEHLSREGQLLIILDGFDEMASRGNYKITLKNFRELNKLALEKSKLILSCRTHYFTSEADVREFHEGQRPVKSQKYTDLYRDIALRANFLIVYLPEFDPQQVEAYIKSRCGDDWQGVLDFIRDTYNLMELSRRPVLLNMIAESKSKIDPLRQVINPGILYQVFTDIWLNHNDWSTVLDVKGKDQLLGEFAKRTVENPSEAIHYTELPKLISQWNQSFQDLDLESVDRELRTASFLVRDNDGHYRFSHRSFLEFFYAKYLLSEAELNRLDSWGKGLYKSEHYRFIRDLISDRSACLEVLQSWIRDSSCAEVTLTNALKCVGGIDDFNLIGDYLKLLRMSKSSEVRRTVATSLRHHASAEVTQALISAFENDEDYWVRTNCALSLSRHENPMSQEYLINLFVHNERLARPESFSHLLFCRHSRAIASSEVIDAFIKNAPLKYNHRESMREMLEMCNWQASNLAKEYCSKFLRSTQSPTNAARAFIVLDNDTKVKFVEKISTMILVYMKRAFVTELISALKGMNDEHIGLFLISIVEGLEPRKVPDRISESVVALLGSDYPELLGSIARRWTDKGYPFEMRFRMMSFMSRAKLDGAYDILYSTLHSNERPLLRIQVLKLLFEHFPGKFVNSCLPIVRRRDNPKVKHFVYQFCRILDHDVAIRELIDCGLADELQAIRVSACEMLSQEKSNEVTDALLMSLRKDRSKWVRAQAFRSLCAPGRKIEKKRLLKACSQEIDKYVLSTIEQLLV